MCSYLMQESPTPTKLIPTFTPGMSDSRRSKLTAERHQVYLDISERNAIPLVLHLAMLR